MSHVPWFPVSPCLSCALAFRGFAVLLALLYFNDVPHRREHGELDSLQLPVPSKCHHYHVRVEHEESAVCEDK